MADDSEWKVDEIGKSKPTDTFSSDRVEAFIVGEATIGNLQGMTKEEADSIAEMAYSLYQGGNVKEAQTIFQGLVLSNPHDTKFHTTLAEIYERQGLVDGAVEEYSLVIALEPDNLEAYVDRGELMMREGNFEQAAADFRHVIDADPAGASRAVLRAKVLAGATAAALRTQKD